MLKMYHTSKISLPIAENRPKAAWESTSQECRQTCRNMTFKRFEVIQPDTIYVYVSICQSVNVSMYQYVSICIFVYLYVSICIQMYPCVSICINMYLYVSICINMHQYVSRCIHVYPYVSNCICMYLCVSRCI